MLFSRSLSPTFLGGSIQQERKWENIYMSIVAK